MKTFEFTSSITADGPCDWDQWVIENSPYGGVRQLACRAKIYDIEHGGKSYFLSGEQSGKRIAGIMVSWIPPKKKSFLRNLLAQYFKIGNGQLVVFEGPVVASGHIDAIGDLLETLDCFAKKLSVNFIRFEAIPHGYLNQQKKQFETHFVRSGYEVREWLTSVVDLETSEEDYFKSLRAKERNTIRKCQKAGVIFVKCSTKDEYLNDFCRNYYISDWSESRIDRCLKQWESLDPAYFSFYVAKTDQGEVLGTLGTYHFQGYVSVRLIARTEVSKKYKLPTQDFLHWSVLNEHRSRGDRWFDLAGISPEPKDDKERGIRFFKEKWGGSLRDAPSYIKDRRPFWLKQFQNILSA